mgnify:CR=1 FL=1
MSERQKEPGVGNLERDSEMRPMKGRKAKRKINR